MQLSQYNYTPVFVFFYQPNCLPPTLVKILFDSKNPFLVNCSKVPGFLLWLSPRWYWSKLVIIGRASNDQKITLSMINMVERERKRYNSITKQYVFWGNSLQMVYVKNGWYQWSCFQILLNKTYCEQETTSSVINGFSNTHCMHALPSCNFSPVSPTLLQIEVMQLDWTSIRHLVELIIPQMFSCSRLLYTLWTLILNRSSLSHCQWLLSLFCLLELWSS